MTMAKNKKIIHYGWFFVALIAALLAAPNGTFIKVAADSFDVLTLNALRFGLIAIVMLPFVVYMWRRFNRKNTKYSILMGLCMSVAAFSYSMALSLSQVSYVSVIELSMPVIFIVYSILMTREKIRTRSIIGIAVAMTGAFLIVALPVLGNGEAGTSINILATVFALLQCLTYPLAIIFSRKANEHGLPVMVSFGISAIVVTIISASLSLLFMNPLSYTADMSLEVIVAIVYSALVVALIARTLNVLSYERIGSVAVSGVSYVESLVAILIPLVILGEQLSVELLVGGALIIIGVYFVETVHHKRSHRHIRLMQHH